jgi:cobalt-zinc-cadmium efflux system protein
MFHQHTYSSSEKNILLAFILNLLFTIAEFIGAYFTNSIAIGSDALHDLGDSLSLGFSYISAKLAKNKTSKTFTFGLRRLTLLSAFVNSLVLISGSIFILYKAVSRIQNIEEVSNLGMFWFSIAGITINTIAALRVSKGKTLNEKIVSWHLIEDVLGWVAIFIGSIIIYFTGWLIIDPILSIIITIYILFNVVRNFKKTVFLFLQGVPEENLVIDVRNKLKEVSEITDVHDLHIWSLDGEHHIITAHLVVNQNLSLQECSEIKQKAKGVVAKLDINHATFEFEFQDESCEQACDY